ncbi:MAG: hypothetical protein CL575_01495 [Altererythrobacter sp.]|nr:hypothetical protein [Altererythrobacter sp.]|tara:strand:+ start:591 stop:839 length:249 start_codon:yes stop_codon:yes gene_type:complete
MAGLSDRPRREPDSGEDGSTRRTKGKDFMEELTMSSLSYRSSRPDGWVKPKTYSDASLRYKHHGKIIPMEEPGFLARLFGAR